MRYDDGAAAQMVVVTLEQGLARLSGERVLVRSVRDEQLTKSTSFAVHRLEVRLDSGRILSVVLKDLNPLRQSPKARQVRPLDLARSRREIWMYEHVLPSLALGTPQAYGHRWEPRRGILWLLLEDVGPHRLGHRLDLAMYAQAAAWAARFHTATAGGWDDARLRRLDRAHYEHAGRLLEANSRRLCGEDRTLVDRVLARYGALLDALDRLPHGLVHGEFFGKNVLVRRDRPAESIAVIDWESAALGPQYVDLVSISAGRWTVTERKAMRHAYLEATPRLGGASATGHRDRQRFHEDVDVVAALQAVSWLAFWVSSDTADAKYRTRVSRWVHELRLSLDGSARA